MRRMVILVAAIVAAFAQTAICQDESEQRLRRSLEGRMVLMKMDMPAINSGVFMYFDDAAVSLDEANYKRLLKANGPSVTKGSKARITGVQISQRGIEIDLDGGGSPERDWIVKGIRLTEPVPLERSDREIDLERQLQYESNTSTASYLRGELDRERERRIMQDERNRQAYARMTKVRADYIDENRKNWGSKLVVAVRSRKANVSLRDMLKSLSKYVELMPRESAAQ